MRNKTQHKENENKKFMYEQILAHPSWKNIACWIVKRMEKPLIKHAKRQTMDRLEMHTRKIIEENYMDISL